MKGQSPKLTPEQVKEIQEAPKHHRTELLAKFYDVSVARISQIRNRTK
jgi:hypothetical protein